MKTKSEYLLISLFCGEIIISSLKKKGKQKPHKHSNTKHVHRLIEVLIVASFILIRIHLLKLK